MKNWTTLILLTVSLLGWTSAHAEYDPDSYLYGKVGFGYNATNDWSSDEVGSNLGLGYVIRLTDWNLFGSLRYEYFNQSASRIIHSDDDFYLSHWGISTEWRFSKANTIPIVIFMEIFLLVQTAGKSGKIPAHLVLDSE
jgi:hypothetical protein